MLCYNMLWLFCVIPTEYSMFKTAEFYSIFIIAVISETIVTHSSYPSIYSTMSIGDISHDIIPVFD